MCHFSRLRTVDVCGGGRDSPPPAGRTGVIHSPVVSVVPLNVRQQSEIPKTRDSSSLQNEQPKVGGRPPSPRRHGQTAAPSATGKPEGKPVQETHDAPRVFDGQHHSDPPLVMNASRPIVNPPGMTVNGHDVRRVLEHRRVDGWISPMTAPIQLVGVGFLWLGHDAPWSKIIKREVTLSRGWTWELLEAAMKAGEYGIWIRKPPVPEPPTPPPSPRPPEYGDPTPLDFAAAEGACQIPHTDPNLFDVILNVSGKSVVVTLNDWGTMAPLFSAGPPGMIVYNGPRVVQPSDQADCATGTVFWGIIPGPGGSGEPKKGRVKGERKKIEKAVKKELTDEQKGVRKAKNVARRVKRTEQLQKQATYLRGNPAAAEAVGGVKSIIRGRGAYSVGQDFGSKAGGFLGSMAESALRNLLGSGEYQVSPTVSPIFNKGASFMPGGNLPRPASSDEVVMGGTEKVISIGIGDATTGPYYYSIYIDPTDFFVTPRLKPMVEQFFNIQFEQLVAFAVPFGSLATSAPAVGQVAMAFSTDIYSQPPGNPTELAAMTGNVCGPCTAPLICAAECATKDQPLRWLKVLSEGEKPPDLSPYITWRLDIQGFNAFEHFDGAMDLHLCYSVRMRNQRLVPQNSLGALIQLVNAGFNFGATPFFAGSTQTYNTIGMSYSDTISSGQPGFLFPYNLPSGTIIYVLLQVEGTSHANVVCPNLNPYGGLAAVDMLASAAGPQSAAAIRIPSTSATTGETVGQWSFSYNGTGSYANPPGLAWAGSAAAPSPNFGLLFVTVVTPLVLPQTQVNPMLFGTKGVKTRPLATDAPGNKVMLFPCSMPYDECVRLAMRDGYRLTGKASTHGAMFAYDAVRLVVPAPPEVKENAPQRVKSLEPEWQDATPTVCGACGANLVSGGCDCGLDGAAEMEARGRNREMHALHGNGSLDRGGEGPVEVQCDLGRVCPLPTHWHQKKKGKAHVGAKRRISERNRDPKAPKMKECRFPLSECKMADDHWHVCVNNDEADALQQMCQPGEGKLDGPKVPARDPVRENKLPRELPPTPVEQPRRVIPDPCVPPRQPFWPPIGSPEYHEIALEQEEVDDFVEDYCTWRLNNDSINETITDVYEDEFVRRLQLLDFKASVLEVQRVLNLPDPLPPVAVGDVVRVAQRPHGIVLHPNFGTVTYGPAHTRYAVGMALSDTQAHARLTAASGGTFNQFGLTRVGEAVGHFQRQSRGLLQASSYTTAYAAVSGLAHTPGVAAVVSPLLVSAGVVAMHSATSVVAAAAAGPLLPAVVSIIGAMAVRDALAKIDHLEPGQALEIPEAPVSDTMSLPNTRRDNKFTRERRIILYRFGSKAPRVLWRTIAEYICRKLPFVTNEKLQVMDTNEFDPTASVVNAQMTAFVFGWTQYARERKMPFYTHKGKQHVVLGPNEFDTARRELIFPSLYDELCKSGSMLDAANVIDSEMTPVKSFWGAVKSVASRLPDHDKYVLYDRAAYKATLRFYNQSMLFQAVLDAMANLTSKASVDFQRRAHSATGHLSESHLKLDPRTLWSSRNMSRTVTSRF